MLQASCNINLMLMFQFIMKKILVHLHSIQ